MSVLFLKLIIFIQEFICFDIDGFQGEAMQIRDIGLSWGVSQGSYLIKVGDIQSVSQIGQKW